MESTSKKAKWTGRLFSILAAAPFLLSSSMKFARIPQVLQGFEHLGWPQSRVSTLGIIEIVSVLLYLIPSVSILGGVILTGFLGGAIATHMRIGEPVYPHIVIGVLIWGGLFLREPRLRALLPVRGKDCIMEKEILVNCSSGVTFAYLKLLKNFQNWNPFLKVDPDAQIEYRGVDGQPGFVVSWEGNRQLGAGEQEITKIIEGHRIEFELRFKRPFPATNTAYFAVFPTSDGQTKVRWHMDARTTFPMTLIGLFINLEKMIEKDFAEGLNQLKTTLERQATPASINSA